MDLNQQNPKVPDLQSAATAPIVAASPKTNSPATGSFKFCAFIFIQSIYISKIYPLLPAQAKPHASTGAPDMQTPTCPCVPVPYGLLELWLSAQ